MIFMVYAQDKDDALAIRMANREAHIAYVKSHEKVKIIGAGPWMDDANEIMLGSLLVVEANCMDCINDWVKNDPYVKAGLTARMSIHPMGGWLAP